MLSSLDRDPICVVALLVSPRPRLSCRTNTDSSRPPVVLLRCRCDGFCPLLDLHLVYVSCAGRKGQLERGITGSRSYDMILNCAQLPLPILDQVKGS